MTTDSHGVGGDHLFESDDSDYDYTDLADDDDDDVEVRVTNSTKCFKTV